MILGVGFPYETIFVTTVTIVENDNIVNNRVNEHARHAKGCILTVPKMKRTMQGRAGNSLKRRPNMNYSISTDSFSELSKQEHLFFYEITVNILRALFFFRFSISRIHFLASQNDHG